MIWASNTTPQQLRRFEVEFLNDGNVATMYRHKLETTRKQAGKVWFEEEW
jgi:hypothetical protein